MTLFSSLATGKGVREHRYPGFRAVTVTDRDPKKSRILGVPNLATLVPMAPCRPYTAILSIWPLEPIHIPRSEPVNSTCNLNQELGCTTVPVADIYGISFAPDAR